jgi:hypothetical protein
VIGEKIEASTDNYTPQVADNQRDHLGGEPLDVNSLGAQQAQREPAPSTATPDAATRDLTRYEPVPAEPLAHGGRSL